MILSVLALAADPIPTRHLTTGAAIGRAVLTGLPRLTHTVTASRLRTLPAVIGAALTGLGRDAHPIPTDQRTLATILRAALAGLIAVAERVAAAHTTVGLTGHAVLTLGAHAVAASRGPFLRAKDN